MRKKQIAALLYNYLQFILLIIFTEISCRDFDLQKQHALLSAEQPFACFDLNEQEEDIQFLQSLIIDNAIHSDKPTVLNHYGDLTQLEPEIIEFLLSCGNSDTDSCRAAHIIHRIVTNCLAAINMPEAWIAIRAFQQNNLYDIARWHIDSERLYTIESGFLYKIVCTLKGPSTLLCNASERTRNEFLKIKSQKYHNRTNLRHDIAQLFKNHCIESAQPGQGTIFIMGSEKIGAIHTEPKMNRDRIFMSIIPGTHEQIQQLYKAWHRSIENRF